MDIKNVTGLPATGEDELVAVVRRLSYFGLTGSRDYVNELIEHLVLHVLAKMSPGMHHGTEIYEQLHRIIDPRLELDQVLAALRRLEAKKQVSTLAGEFDETAQFRLDTTLNHELTVRYKEQVEFESRVFHDWEQELQAKYPELSPSDLNALRKDLLVFSFRLFSLHSIESVSLYFGSEEGLRTSLQQMEDHSILELLPPRRKELTTIRMVELARFFKNAPLERKRFISQQLNSMFMLYMMQLDPKSAQRVAETIANAVTGGKLFLDTNYLYRLFGLDGSDLQSACQRLLDLSRGLGYQIVVSPRTVEEYEISMSHHLDRVKDFPMIAPELAQAALSTTLKEDFYTHYWKRSLQAKGWLDREGYYELFANVDALLKHYNVSIDDTFDKAIRLKESSLIEEESLLTNLVPEKAFRHDSIVNHDAHMRVLILQLRQGHEPASPLEVPYWLLTLDSRLVQYDKRVRPRQKLRIPYCVLSSTWMQLLSPFGAGVKGYDIAQADNLDSPLFRLFKGPEPEMIQEIITRLTAISNNIPPELMIKAITNTAFIDAFSEAKEESKRDKIVEEYFLGKILSDLEAEKAELSAELSQMTATHKEMKDDLLKLQTQLRENAQKQDELSRTRNELNNELSQVKSGSQELSGKLHTSEAQLAQALIEHQELLTRISDLSHSEESKQRDLAQLKATHDKFGQEYDRMLSKVTGKHKRQQRIMMIVIVWLACGIAQSITRPWTLQGNLPWLALTFCVIALVITEFIALYERKLDIVLRVTLIAVAILALVVVVLMPFGVAFPDVIGVAASIAQVIGTVYAAASLRQDGSVKLAQNLASSSSAAQNPSSSHQVSSLPETISSDQIVTWITIGDQALVSGDYETAIEVYRQAGDREKLANAEKLKQLRDVRLLAEQAHSLEASDNLSEAVKIYGRLVKLQPKNSDWKDAVVRVNTELWLNREYTAGAELIKQQAWKRARDTLSRVAKKRPNYRNTLALLEKVERHESGHPSHKHNSRNGRRTLVFTLVGLFLLISLLLAGTKFWQSPKYNSAITSIMSRTPRPQGDDTVSQSPRVILEESFDTGNKNGWYVGTFDNNSMHFSSEIINNRYKISIQENKNGGAIPLLLPSVDTKDFMLRFDASITKCTGICAIGALFRSKDNSDFNTVLFRTDQTYGVFSWANGVWKSLLPYTKSNAFEFRNNSAGTFLVVGKGSEITVFANGIQLSTFTADSIDEHGQFGLVIEEENTNQVVNVEFSNLIIEQAP